MDKDQLNKILHQFPDIINFIKICSNEKLFKVNIYESLKEYYMLNNKYFFNGINDLSLSYYFSIPCIYIHEDFLKTEWIKDTVIRLLIVQYFQENKYKTSVKIERMFEDCPLLSFNGESINLNRIIDIFKLYFKLSYTTIS